MPLSGGVTCDSVSGTGFYRSSDVRAIVVMINLGGDRAYGLIPCLRYFLHWKELSVVVMLMSQWKDPLIAEIRKKKNALRAY